jgi:hypothetical protein
MLPNMLAKIPEIVHKLNSMQLSTELLHSNCFLPLHLLKITEFCSMSEEEEGTIAKGVCF